MTETVAYRLVKTVVSGLPIISGLFYCHMIHSENQNSQLVYYVKRHELSADVRIAVVIGLYYGQVIHSVNQFFSQAFLIEENVLFAFCLIYKRLRDIMYFSCLASFRWKIFYIKLFTFQNPFVLLSPRWTTLCLNQTISKRNTPMQPIRRFLVEGLEDLNKNLRNL